MDFRVDHYFHLGDSRDELDRLTDLVIELKEIFMSGVEDLLREVAEQKELTVVISAALTNLAGVAVAQQAQVVAAQAALADAQAALTAANASTADLDAKLASAAAGLEEGQAAIQAQIDALPPATP